MGANDSARLCANNCGFYANPNTQNLCSHCHADLLLKLKLQHSTDLAGACEPASGLDEPAPKGADRCKACKRKVGLLGFKCRCGDSFCGQHRHPEEHSCGVDLKVIGKEILANQIVECKADKLEFRV